MPRFSKAIQPDHAKERGEEEEGSKKRETRRKARARGVGGGGGHVWYRALLECDWMLCCRGLSANLYLRTKKFTALENARWRGSWVERLWPGWATAVVGGGKRGFHVQPRRSSLIPPFFFFPLLPFWTFFSQRKGTPSPLSDRRLAGWGGDETALNEKRLRVEKGAEPERNVARRRGADDSGGIQRIHSWPARCYVWMVWQSLVVGLRRIVGGGIRAIPRVAVADLDAGFGETPPEWASTGQLCPPVEPHLGLLVDKTWLKCPLGLQPSGENVIRCL